MPTSNKTTNLNLNSWLSTDKPKREDFVSDNNIIDSILGSHIADEVMHLSTSDRESLANPFYFDILVGTGDSSYTHVLDIEPQFVFVYLKNKPLIKYDCDNSCTVCNCGIAVAGYGGTEGITLNGSYLKLNQSQSYPSEGGTYTNLNSNAGQYICIALR